MNGQCLTDLKKILPERNTREPGYQVALGGSYMVVSSNAEDTLGYAYSGGAYLYKKSPAGWNFLALLKPSNPVSFLQFGAQVRIDSLGETVTVSSYGYNDGVNNVLARSDVYVFQKPASGWITMTETERISIPDSLFSITSIALSNDGKRVIAGKYYTEKNGTGKVYVYTRDNLTELFSSKPPITLISPAGSASFGSSVSLDKHYVAIASDYYNGAYGVIFVYKFASDTIMPIAQLKTRPNSGFSTWRQIVLKDNLIIQPGQSPSTALFVYAKPTGLDWKNANETAVLPLMDSTKINLGSTPAVQVLDSLNIGVVSMYLNNAVMNGVSPTGYYEVFNKPLGQSWAHCIPVVVLDEKLPVNGFNSIYGSSSAWNGKDFAFTPGLDATGSHFINSITTITKSNGVWGSILKTRVPRLNSSNHYYGQSIVSRNNILLVGDPHDGEAGSNSGAVYIYGEQSGNWVKKNKILPGWESMTDTFFGGSISLTDSILAIGAMNYGQSGRVYLYQKIDSAWNVKLVQQIDSPAEGIYQFGDQLAISSKLLAVSAFDANGIDGTNNAFVVYERNGLGWKLSQVVDVHNAWLHYQTMRLSIRNDSIFVYTGLGGFSGTGTALFIYTKNNSGHWTATSTFVVPQNFSSFDVSFKVSENHLFMGLPGVTVFGKSNVGAVVVYSKSQGKPWPNGLIYHSNILYPNDTIANGYFGYDVAVIENTLLVGAPGTDYVVDNNLNTTLRNVSGATYVFASQDYFWKTAIPLLKLQGSQYNIPLSDHMGWSVAADYNHYFSSARYETNDHGSRAGAVYTIPTPPLVKLMAPVCSQSAPLKLFGYPFGGTWSGPGLVSGSNGTFDPQLVGKGKYLLTYKTPNCTYEGKLQIEVLPSPNVTLASANTFTICPTNPQKIAIASLDSATYQWYYQSFSNNSLIAISGQTTSELMVGLSGYYYCSVTKNGCSTASPLVTVNYETSSTSIGPQDVVCNINTPIQLKANPSGGTWKGNGVSNASAGVFNPSGLLNGKYPITYSFTSQLGCKYSLADTVLVDTIPAIKLNRVPGDFCLTGLVTLQALPTVKHLNYRWKYKANNQSAWLDVDTISLAKRNFIESGYYESVVFNTYCQAKTDSLQVGLLNDLPLNLTPNDSIVQVCLDPTVTLSVSSNRNDVSFAWYSSDSVNNNFNKVGEGESISVSRNGFYKVKAEVGFCESESKIKYVKFLPHDSIWVPNVFTPNGDNLNPDFKIWSNVNSYSLVILNRWGQEIYTADQNNKPWDGENHPTGTYYWFIQFRNCRNEQKTAQGFVQIMR